MSTPEDACDECGHFHGRGLNCMKIDGCHWPHLCECEQCREWYLEQALEWAEHDERERDLLS